MPKRAGEKKTKVNTYAQQYRDKFIQNLQSNFHHSEALKETYYQYYEAVESQDSYTCHEDEKLIEIK